MGNFAIYAVSKGVETYAVEAELLVSLLYEKCFLNNLDMYDFTICLEINKMDNFI